MAVAMYYTWVQQGKPLEPSNPVREIVERFKAKYPSAGPFSWHANDEHYQSNEPGDHTPYSHDGYKTSPSPYPIVFATDVMNQPSKGVDCQKLFNYWLAEAKAGRMPWLKYLIWQAKIYDVRHGWATQASSEHFDHIHISTRTDYQRASLGTWSLFPDGGDLPDMDANQDAKLTAMVDFKDTMALDTNGPAAGGVQNFPVGLTAYLKQLGAKVDTISAKVDALSSPEPLPVDLDAVRTIVREELDKTHLSD
jgi:hypothetical protein